MKNFLSYKTLVKGYRKMKKNKYYVYITLNTEEGPVNLEIQEERKERRGEDRKEEREGYDVIGTSI